MKNIIGMRAILITLILCSLLLTACSDAEWDLVADAIFIWAQEEGLVVDGELQVSALAETVVKDNINNWMNTEENVQLDGLDVVRDIERANELANQAVADLDNERIQEAIALRPNDWLLREKEAVIGGAYHNGPVVESALLQSDTLLRESLGPFDDCIQARRAQLEQRVALTWDEIMRQEGGTPGNPETTATELREINEAARNELQLINSSGWTEFCNGWEPINP